MTSTASTQKNSMSLKRDEVVDIVTENKVYDLMHKIRNAYLEASATHYILVSFIARYYSIMIQPTLDKCEMGKEIKMLEDYLMNISTLHQQCIEIPDDSVRTSTTLEVVSRLQHEVEIELECMRRKTVDVIEEFFSVDETDKQTLEKYIIVRDTMMNNLPEQLQKYIGFDGVRPFNLS